MKKEPENKAISAEVLAAYLDGNATAQESLEILEALPEDAELRELMHISQSVDADMGLLAPELDLLPVTSMAASCGENHMCCLDCEQYILRQLHIPYDEREMLQNAIQHQWLKKQGTALHHIGRSLETLGLAVVRRYESTLDSLYEALQAGAQVIAVVDGGELLGDELDEKLEDIFVGEIPDHTVVVRSYDPDKGLVVLHDPDSQHDEDVYPVGQFADAWADSKNYMVLVTPEDRNLYRPQPIDLSKVEISAELDELREAIAENAHEVWAYNRKADGWSYGPKRDDALKQTPDMVPYSRLPENEKKYDREMAMNTIKLMKKLGYDLVKRQNTALYQELKQRLEHAGEECRCPRCTHVVSPDQKFCDHCGQALKTN